MFTYSRNLSVVTVTSLAVWSAMAAVATAQNRVHVQGGPASMPRMSSSMGRSVHTNGTSTFRPSPSTRLSSLSSTSKLDSLSSSHSFHPTSQRFTEDTTSRSFTDHSTRTTLTHRSTDTSLASKKSTGSSSSDKWASRTASWSRGSKDAQPRGTPNVTLRSIDSGTGRPGSRTGGMAGKPSTGALTSASGTADRQIFVPPDAQTMVWESKMAAIGTALSHFPPWAFGCRCCGGFAPLWGWAVPVAVAASPAPAPASIEIPLASVGDPDDPQ